MNGYSVSLASGQEVTGRNFDDFHSSLYPTTTVSHVEYYVYTPGVSTPANPSTLMGDVKQGDRVAVHFDLSKPEMINLVAYTSPNGEADTPDLRKEQVFSSAESSTTLSGAQWAEITVPNGFFQLDFVAGPVIHGLSGNANVSYAAQGRLIASTMGGTEVNGTSTVSGIVDVINASGQKSGLDLQPGVELILTGYDYLGNEVKEVTYTDSKGDYSFTGLTASDAYGYRITQVVPTGYVQEGSNAGSTGGSGGKYISTFVNTNTTSTRNDFTDKAST